MTIAALLAVIMVQTLATTASHMAGGNERAIGDAEACPLTQMRPLVGHRFNAATRAKAQAIAGRHPLRWLMPEATVPQDHVENRINAQVGRDGRVAAIRCG